MRKPLLVEGPPGCGKTELAYATSLMDYLFRWMELKFLLKNEQGELFESRPMSIHAMPPPNEKGEVEALKVNLCNSEMRLPATFLSFANATERYVLPLHLREYKRLLLSHRQYNIHTKITHKSRRLRRLRYASCVMELTL